MNETQLENHALDWFAETGWQITNGPEIAPDSDRPLREDYKDVLLEAPLKRAIQRINSGLPSDAVDEAVHKLKTVDHPVVIPDKLTPQSGETDPPLDMVAVIY